MTLPLLTLAIGSLLIWAGITGQNPIAVLKEVLGGGGGDKTTGATRNIKPIG